MQQYVERGSAELHYAYKMLEAGAFKLEPPQNIAAMVADIRRWGEFGMIPALNARRTPNRTAIIDDFGEITFKELDDAAHEVANGLLAKGIKGGDGVAILARNHRWFLIAVYGAARAGARIILLNSEFSGPQIKEVSEREGAKLIIYDDEYCQAVAKADPPLGKLRALGVNPDKEEPSGSTDETLEDLVARSSGKPAPKATKHSSIIILTSGTTGTPKGANRSTPPSLAPIGGILSHVPFKSGEVTSLPAPMFHALGFLHATIAMMLGDTLVLRRRFKPPTVFADIEKHKVTAVVVVPVMLSRMLDALEKMDTKPDLSSLRIVFVSGSQLGAELAQRALKDLGPVVYNLYGSTEIAFATIARPKDLEKNPATVGPVVKGVKVKILDDSGNELPQGEVGRIFVGNTFPFEGYTGGGHKQIIDGLHVLRRCRLFRRARPAVRQRSRRRNDRVWRRERVSRRGRGFDQRPSRRRRGHRGGRGGQGVGAPAARVRGQDRRRQHRRGGHQVLRQRASGPLQGAARGGLPRRTAAQPDRKGPQTRVARDLRRRRRRKGVRRRRRRKGARSAETTTRHKRNSSSTPVVLQSA